MKTWVSYVLFIGIAIFTEVISGALTSGSMKTYEQLQKPPLTPPGILFPIVWTVLYLLMGIGAARIYQTGAAEVRQALILWGIQLAVSFVWSLIFFNAGAFLAAFLWLLLLWGLVLAMILSFRALDRTAALLQIPYLLWITFAGYLNVSIWRLNP